MKEYHALSLNRWQIWEALNSAKNGVHTRFPVREERTGWVVYIDHGTNPNFPDEFRVFHRAASEDEAYELSHMAYEIGEVARNFFSEATNPFSFEGAF